MNEDLINRCFQAIGKATVQEKELIARAKLLRETIAIITDSVQMDDPVKGTSLTDRPCKLNCVTAHGWIKDDRLLDPQIQY